MASRGDTPRTQQAKLAALTRSASEPSGAAMTEKARATFRQSFYDATDPDLPEAERQRQAEAAYRAHMRKIARRPRTGRPAVDVGDVDRQALADEIRAELLAEFRDMVAEIRAAASADAV
jgi:hypothetical protein